MPIQPEKWVNSRDLSWIFRLRQREDILTFQLQVNESGVPTSCSLPVPSKSEAIDNKTCRLLLERARFTPPTDERGQALASVFNGKFVWRVINPKKVRIDAFDPGVERMALEVSPDGRIQSCKVSLEGTRLWGAIPTDCERLIGQALFYTAPFAKAHSEIVEASSISHQDALPPAVQGAALLIQRSAILEFREDGRYIRCVPLPPVGELPLMPPCEYYPPEASRSEKAAQRRVYHYSLHGKPR